MKWVVKDFRFLGENDQGIKMMSTSNLKMSYMERASDIYQSFHPIHLSPKKLKETWHLVFTFTSEHADGDIWASFGGNYLI